MWKSQLKSPILQPARAQGRGADPAISSSTTLDWRGASTENGDTGTLAAFIGHSSQGSLCLQKSQKSMIGKHKTYRINFLFSYIILIHFAFTHFPVECKKYYLFRWLCKLVALHNISTHVLLLVYALEMTPQFSWLCVWMRMWFIWS